MGFAAVQQGLVVTSEVPHTVLTVLSEAICVKLNSIACGRNIGLRKFHRFQG